MKKITMIGLMSLLLMGFCIDEALANSKKNQLSDNYLSFSFVIHPVSVGYKRQVARSFYFTGNVDYVGDVFGVGIFLYIYFCKGLRKQGNFGRSQIWNLYRTILFTCFGLW